MAKVTRTSDALESIRLDDEASGAAAYVAPARGGMITRFVVGDAPVLFLDETTLRDPSKSVRGGVPVLFPIAGKLPGGRYAARGREYALKQHGFARELPWTVLDESTDDGASVTLGLRADDVTRSLYPFQFALRFTYRLRHGALFIEQSFANEDDVPMPIQPGLHPYFYVPAADKSRARVVTDATRAYDNRAGREVAVPRPLPLGGDEVDLFLLDHHPREATLERGALPAVRVGLGDEARIVVVWTLPGRDFVCVEPWRAMAGALATGTASFVPPGRTDTATTSISLVPSS